MERPLESGGMALIARSAMDRDLAPLESFLETLKGAAT
jgi:hypothetical protein